jgi:hypothetical protein
MPVSEATFEKTAAVYAKCFKELPVAKDLPRLAKYITICNQGGLPLSYLETKPINLDTFSIEQSADSEFLGFIQVRRVLLTLALALETTEKCLELETLFEAEVNNKVFLTPEYLSKFLDLHFGGNDGKVVKILKCINQVTAT